MKWFTSLQAKYMMIILTALFFIYVLILTSSLIVFNLKKQEEMETIIIEEKWHETASNLEKPTEEMVRNLFMNWKQKYPDSTMFWVNENGNLNVKVDPKTKFPEQWTATYTAKFIKERYDEDPYTVIAFLGKDDLDGFIVFEIPREKLEMAPNEANANSLAIIVPVGILLFVTISYLFFRKIRKRLLSLQEAMGIRDEAGLPVEVPIKKDDEIGTLEQSFNQMVDELRESKEREQEEEQIRKELIANLSHDLRTPLTKIRAHAYSVGLEPLSQKGQESIAIIDDSITKTDRLIENLMSYTLLHANKLQFHPSEIDIIRLVRNSIASWYPLFEMEGFTIDIQVDTFVTPYWLVDPLWVERIMDNLFQNVFRHANDGKYIRLTSESTNSYDAIVLEDHGQGMNHPATEKGAGVGLAIVDLMVKHMNLDWNVETSANGTIIKILRYK